MVALINMKLLLESAIWKEAWFVYWLYSHEMLAPYLFIKAKQNCSKLSTECPGFIFPPKHTVGGLKHCLSCSVNSCRNTKCCSLGLILPAYEEELSLVWQNEKWRRALRSSGERGYCKRNGHCQRSRSKVEKKRRKRRRMVWNQVID